MINIPHGKYDDRALDRELRALNSAILELYSLAGVSTGGVSTVVSSGGGGSSTTVGTTDVRHGIVSLSSGGNTIAFATAMSSAAFTLPRVRCYATDTGVYEDVESVISNKTINGFTITVIKACTCEYVALL